MLQAAEPAGQGKDDIFFENFLMSFLVKRVLENSSHVPYSLILSRQNTVLVLCAVSRLGLPGSLTGPATGGRFPAHPLPPVIHP